MMKRLLTYILLVPMLVLTACETRDAEEYDLMTEDTLIVDQDNRQARAELLSWLDEIDENLAQLETRMQTAGESVDANLDELRARRDELRADLQEAQNEVSAWTATTADDLQDQMRDLDADIEKARLVAIDQRDEFIAEVRARLQEIVTSITASPLSTSDLRATRNNSVAARRPYSTPIRQIRVLSDTRPR